MERDLGVTAETLALFVRFWLTITPPLPNDDQGAAKIKGRERFDGFIEALGRRLQKGQSFLREIPDDIGGVPSIDDDDDPGRKSEEVALKSRRPRCRSLRRQRRSEVESHMDPTRKNGLGP